MLSQNSLELTSLLRCFSQDTGRTETLSSAYLSVREVRSCAGQFWQSTVCKWETRSCFHWRLYRTCDVYTEIYLN